MLDYEPISRCRDNLATLSVADMQMRGEFNFVYCNERGAREKINLLFSGWELFFKTQTFNMYKNKKGETLRN